MKFALAIAVVGCASAQYNKRNPASADRFPEAGESAQLYQPAGVLQPAGAEFAQFYQPAAVQPGTCNRPDGGCVQTITKIVDVPVVQYVDRPVPVQVPTPVHVPVPVPTPVRVEVRKHVPVQQTRHVPVPTPVPVDEVREVVRTVQREVIQNVQQPVPVPNPIPVPNIQYVDKIQTRERLVDVPNVVRNPVPVPVPTPTPVYITPPPAPCPAPYTIYAGQSGEYGAVNQEGVVDPQAGYLAQYGAPVHSGAEGVAPAYSASTLRAAYGASATDFAELAQRSHVPEVAASPVAGITDLPDLSGYAGVQ